MFANVEVAGYLINSLTVYFPFFFAPDMMMISLKKKIVPLWANQLKIEESSVHAVNVTTWIQTQDVLKV